MNATRANNSRPFPNGAAASARYDATGCRIDRRGKAAGPGSWLATAATAARLSTVPTSRGTRILITLGLQT
jgi:hypothetical protein